MSTVQTSAPRGWLVVATVLGAAHAGISLLWLLGSTWLLDTVGEPFVSWGTDRGAGVLAALAAVVVAKLVVVALVVVAVLHGRFRRLAALAAGALLVYGALMTVGNAAVALDLISPSDSADLRAIRWHATLWDPWFALWGAAGLLALRATRRSRTTT